MKKMLALLLALALVIGLVACGAKEAAEETVEGAAQAAEEVTEEAAEETAEEVTEEAPEEAAEEAVESDLAYVQEKGTLVVGVTDFAPMDYKDDNDEWIGFDADMAKAFAASLGVECEIVEIDWDSKVMELNAGYIDAVWNGMTITDEVRGAMEPSTAYCNNAQVIVVNANVAEQYADVASCMDLQFAVEAGSAGEAAAMENGFSFTSVESQATALMEVASGSSDACVIDLMMAGAMIGEGTSYPDLVSAAELTVEEYGVGFRTGSNLVAELNAFLKECAENGKLEEIATKYNVQAALIK